MLRQVQPPPFGVHERLEGLLEAFRHRHGSGDRVVYGGLTVGIGEGVGERAGREALDLTKHFTACGDVNLCVRAVAESLPGTEDLEQVELDVAQICFVVAHDHPLTRGRAQATGYPSVGIILLIGNLRKCFGEIHRVYVARLRADRMCS